MHKRITLKYLTPLALMLALLGATQSKTTQASGDTRYIARSGTGFPTTGDASPANDTGISSVEFAGQTDDDSGSDAYSSNIIDRSLSPNGSGNGVSVHSGQKAKSHPAFNVGFEGLNFYQQRYSRQGNQLSLEPPDQGLCVGNGYIVETVNDVLNIFNSAGQSVLPDNTATNIVSGFPRDVNHAVDLNSFFGYPPAVDRAHSNLRGPQVTDPSCLYDAQTQRFFLVVLTLETFPTGGFTTVNHLDIAVSRTADPTGLWNIYRVDVTNDGTNAGGVNPCPCLGDYPHIGADGNGFYVTTNAYPWATNGFDGAQIYAFSKAQLAAGAASVTMAHIDTFGMVNMPTQETPAINQPGFTVWPAQSGFDNGHTEFFMSSNAADEATHPVAGFGGAYVSNQIVVWTLSNTSSLNGVPALNLSNKVLNVETYALPPKFKQPGSATPPGVDVPQGHCLNDNTTLTIAGIGCWTLLVSATAHAGGGPEVISRPDANDTRMQQVTYANGKLWGALDTAVNPDGGPTRAGIAYFIVNPNSGKVVLQGYLGAAGYDFMYPAIGVTQSGRGVMAFTASGETTFPSAAYAAIDAIVGVSAWGIVPGGEGQADDDGFTGYKQQRFPNPIRPRWGDYGAAAVDGNSIWIASEYISGACSYTDWGGPFFVGGSGDNLIGTCGGATHGPGKRAALGNWSTFISKFTP